jgi:hypothetical protein
VPHPLERAGLHTREDVARRKHRCFAAKSDRWKPRS